MAHSKPDLNPKPIPGPAEISAEHTDKLKATTSPSGPSHSDKRAWPGAFIALGQIFGQLKKNPEPAYVFVGTYTVLAFISQAANGFATPMEMKGGGVASLESLTSLIFLLALPVYTLALADRKTITVNQFIAFDLTKYLTIIGATLLTVLIVFISAIPLLIPLIWVVPWLSLSSYVIVDKNVGVIDSLKESKRLAQDHKSKVWGIIGMTIGLAIIGSIFSFIPLVGPIVAATIGLLSAGLLASLYRWLQKNVPANI
jgi:hypothetical protein